MPICGDFVLDEDTEVCDDENCNDECTACNNGYELDGDSICVDIDECDIGTDNCGTGTVCVNSDGSFNCECANGYTDMDMVCSINDSITVTFDSGGLGYAAMIAWCDDHETRSGSGCCQGKYVSFLFRIE